ncbi:MAG: baseplate J/gp47 family protein [Chloroflexota bacterium]
MLEILQIDATTTVEAIRQTLAQVKVKKVVFVLPDQWTELDNIARMRLLMRQAQTQGVEVALVTNRQATRQSAKQLGIPVFLHPQQAANGRWQMNPVLPRVNLFNPQADLPDPPPWRKKNIAKQQARPLRYKARQRRIQAEERYRRPTPLWLRIIGYLFMGSLIVAFLGAFSLYVLPAATVTLTPGRELLVVEVPLTADPNLDVSDLETGELTARVVESNIEEQGTVATSGFEQKAVNNARGNVIFSNLGRTQVRIPVGTVVNTTTGTPVSFRTTQAATVEGGVNQRVTVPVEAEEPGIQGNVRVNTINTVNGALRFRVRVSNQAGTFGGGSELVSTVTQADKDVLLTQLRDRVDASAYTTLQGELDPDEWLPEDSVQTFVIAQAFDQFNDDEASELSLSLRSLAQGVAVDNDLAREAMQLALENAVPERGRVVAESIAFKRYPQITVVGRSVQFTMVVEAEYIIPIDDDEIREAIANMTPEEASTVLMARWNLARPPDIYRDPEWLSTLPPFANRIQLRIEYEGSTQ